MAGTGSAARRLTAIWPIGVVLAVVAQAAARAETFTERCPPLQVRKACAPPADGWTACADVAPQTWDRRRIVLPKWPGVVLKCEDAAGRVRASKALRDVRCEPGPGTDDFVCRPLASK